VASTHHNLPLSAASKSFTGSAIVFDPGAGEIDATRPVRTVTDKSNVRVNEASGNSPTSVPDSDPSTIIAEKFPWQDYKMVADVGGAQEVEEVISPTRLQTVDHQRPDGSALVEAGFDGHRVRDAAVEP
jgi:hypothetical protein